MDNQGENVGFTVLMHSRYEFSNYKLSEFTSGFGVSEGPVVFSGYDREHVPVTCPVDPVVSVGSGLCCFIVAVDEAFGGEAVSALVLLYSGHSPALRFRLSHLLSSFLCCSRR